MKEEQIRRKIEEFEEKRKELYEIYARLDNELFDTKVGTLGKLIPSFKQSETKYVAKKLSLEELSQAVSLAIGERLNILSQSREESEKEIVELVESIYKASYRGFYSPSIPSIQKKIMKDGNIKYWLAFEGGCFISTACVESAGLPDNCDELQTLRRFRDEYVTSTTGGKELIRDYYRIAPEILSSIRTRPDSHDILSRIFEEDVLVSVDKVKKGDSAEALQHYKEMVSKLRQEYKR